MKNKECSHCGYVGHPVHDEYSSLAVDAAVWLFAFAIAGITGIIYLVVLGPLFSIWHLITFRSHRCPKCGKPMRVQQTIRPASRRPP